MQNSSCNNYLLVADELFKTNNGLIIKLFGNCAFDEKFELDFIVFF